VDDLIEGIYRLLESGYGEPVNVGNPHEMTILEFAEAVQRVTATTSPIHFEPLPQDDPKVRQPDISRAQRVLGWEPKVGLEDGLRRTVGYFRDEVAARHGGAAGGGEAGRQHVESAP
jgi:dTDP-glucose 4,6-dehydratase